MVNVRGRLIHVSTHFQKTSQVPDVCIVDSLGRKRWRCDAAGSGIQRRVAGTGSGSVAKKRSDGGAVAGTEA